MLGQFGYIAGIVPAETFAIVSEKLLYDRWINLRSAGRQGWQAVITANFVSWIAGIVIGILFPFFLLHGPSKHYTKSKDARIPITVFEEGLQLFQDDTSRLPTTAKGLDALIHNPDNLRD
jgi:hypothetical protein